MSKSEQLIKENEELIALVYKASHNLKGPIASLVGINNLAKKKVEDKEALKFFELIGKSVENLQIIVSDLLALSRTTGASIEMEVVDPGEIVDGVYENLRFSEELTEVEFQKEFNHKNTFMTDKVLFSSIVQNLMYNAFKYKKKDVNSSVVKVTTNDVEKGLELSVVDDGVGIPENLTERIFEMFFRAHEDYSGNGLGLYIVRKSLEKLNGKIKVISKEGEGSEFRVILPSNSTKAGE